MTDQERRKRHAAIIRYIKTKYPDVYIVPGLGWSGPGWEAAKADERTMLRQAGIGLDPTLNPLSMSTPEKIGIGVAIVGGLAAAVYYMTRPAAAASPAPAPAPTPTPAPSGGGGSVNVTGGGKTAPPTTGPQTFPATALDDGRTFDMSLGDTLLVTLTLPPGVSDYSPTATGTIMTKGTYWNDGTKITQPWIAAQKGMEAITYQRAASGASGPSVTFNIVVS